MIGLVDYGVGNLRAFLNVYAQLGVPAMRCRTPDELDGCTGIILPGVGAFDWAMARLNSSGLLACLQKKVLGEHTPLLGVCVGMQMLADRSEEGSLPGLGWIPGEVRRFAPDRSLRHLPVPHIGWNDVAPVQGEQLFRNIVSPRYYFLHSYYFSPSDPTHCAGITDYGGLFASAVRRSNVCGTQFHPEKSHSWGVRLLANFATLQ